MKSINIKGATKSKNGVTIYLGNGTVHHFTNQKQANLFLTITNKALTQNLYELRFLYVEIWKQYQRDWGYFGHNKPTMTADVRHQDRECSDLLKATEQSFNLCIERSSWANGNHFVFTHLNRVIYNLKQVLLVLNRIHRRKSNTVELYEFDNLFKRIQSVEHDIITYGQHKAAVLVKVPLHIEEIAFGKTFCPEPSELKIVS